MSAAEAGSRPRFSIVVATRGRAEDLTGCVASLAALDYPRRLYETIVVVDGPDPLAERVAGAAPAGLDVRTVVHQRPLGVSAARNSGIERAAAEFIAFTDDDCVAAPGWLTALAAELQRNPSSAIGGRTLNAATRNRYSTASQAVIDAAHAHWNRDPAGPGFFASNNLAMPAEALREVGGFDTRFAPVGGEDRELCDRWIASGLRMRYAPDALVYHLRQLTLRSFLRQHYRYGRGARRFHRLRSMRNGARNVPEPGFYAELVRQARAHARGSGRASLSALIVLSQAANFTGYALDRSPIGTPAHGDARVEPLADG